jgi:gamma-glutamyltranspeptidase / glutathione hydrolase
MSAARRTFSRASTRRTLGGMNGYRHLIALACAPLLALVACSGPRREPLPPSIDPVARVGPVEAPHASPVDFPASWRYAPGAEPASGRRGMVVTTDSLASAAGLEILRAGGNAVDAAIAVQFALAVVHPAAGNVGGGGFLVARLADDERVALDFRETAPGGASKDMYLDAAGDVTDASWVGHLATGVPGSVAGMEAAHERYGTLPWARLLEPAIRLAIEGFEVTSRHNDDISGDREHLSRFPVTAAIFLPGGEAPPVGSTFRQPDLGRTLRAIADSGSSAFYRGWIADSVAAEMRRGGGLITKADLSAYRAVWREPIEVDYRGWTVISMPPPSSGGTTMGEILNIVESRDLGTFGWHSPEAIHLAVEAMRRAYADRNYFLGDPDFVEMPIARLLSQAYADSIAGTIDAARASRSEEFNRVPLEPTETTHFSIVDGAGNAVAVTTTLNGGFGSGVVVRGAGFLLNNEMDDFTSKPGVPNAYGLVQGEANAIAPGRRMLSAMTPTVLVSPDGRTELVTGTPGGSTIITSIFQIVTNHVDFGLPVRTSVDAPRFHHQNLPDQIRYERGGLSGATVAALRRMGHAVAERSGTSGDVESIWIAPDGTLHGAADRRGQGMALGY